MSYQDPDWYGDKVRRREAWPHPLSATRRPFRLSPIASVVIAVVGMFGSAHVHDLWLRTHPSTSKGTTAEVRTTTPRLTERALEEAPVHRAIAPAFEPPVTRQVVRCSVNGRTTYSAAADCSSGGRIVAVDPSRSEIEGGFSEYELQMLRSADARIDRDQAAALVAPVQTFAISTKGAECAGLEQQIHSLDSRARSPISGSEQEAIRAERMRARSRQFELHC